MTKVLDYGFVNLVESMGSDLSIVQAARVSYGEGSKGEFADRKLIKYLIEHKHGSPLEMCLHGNTNIPILPTGRATQKQYTIKQIADAFKIGGKSNSWVKLLKIRTVNIDGYIVSTKIKHAKYMGRKRCYKVIEKSAAKREIVVTDNHPILRNLRNKYEYKSIAEAGTNSEIVMNGIDGSNDETICIDLWRKGKKDKEIAEYINESMNTVYRYLKKNGIDTKRRNGFEQKSTVKRGHPKAQSCKPITIDSKCEVCGDIAEEIHHLDKNQHNNKIENLIHTCRTCHKGFHNKHIPIKTYSSSIESIEDVGEHDVYDLEVESDNHNFVANGFIVHNCQFKFHVKCPIFVMRQWIRHRIGCLSGDVKLNFELPSGKSYPLKISDVHRKFHNDQTFEVKGKQLFCIDKLEDNVEYSVKILAEKVGRNESTIREIIREGRLKVISEKPYTITKQNWIDYTNNRPKVTIKQDKIKNVKLRCVGKNNEILLTKIKDIWESGIQKVYKLTLENGFNITLTGTHLCLTNEGWLKFEDAKDIENIKFLSLVNEAKYMEKVDPNYDHKDEIWRPYPLIPKYLVSNCGRIKTTVNTRNGIILPKLKKQTMSNAKRKVVGLSVNGKTFSVDVAKMVLLTFFGKSDDQPKLQVLHKDDNQINNHIDNLYWDDDSDNQKDKVRNERSCQLISKFKSVKSIEYVGEEMTYDLEVKGPHHNFSANKIIVHNSFNEISARYTKMEMEFYTPVTWRKQDTKNKQGSTGNFDPMIYTYNDPDNKHGIAISTSRDYIECIEICVESYERMIEAGIAKEMARMVLPVSLYTEFYWSVNLRSLINFIELRTDFHAQWEIQQYGNVIKDITKQIVPWTMEALETLNNNN